jgi:hypothetical protein
MKGFETTTIRDIHLVIEQQARIDANLAIKAVGQEVIVTIAPPLRQTEDAVRLVGRRIVTNTSIL